MAWWNALYKQPRNSSRKHMRTTKIPILEFILRNISIPGDGLSSTQFAHGASHRSIIPTKNTLLKPMAYDPSEVQRVLKKKKKNGQLRGSILMEGTSPLNHENVEISECDREEPGNQQSCWRNLAKVNQDHILWEQMTIVTGETGKKFWRDKKPRYMKSSSSDWSSWGKQQQRPCCRPTLTWWPRRVWQRTKNSYYTSPIILLLVGSSVFPCVTENDFFVLNDIEHQTFY